MSKMMNSNYSEYSSGLSSFQDQSTSDTQKFSQPIPKQDIINIPDNGRYSVFDIANWFLSKEPMTQKNCKSCAIMPRPGVIL